jgi:hypothetical protein
VLFFQRLSDVVAGTVSGVAGVVASYVVSFNGRTGAVTPQAGDYTAAQVGADPAGAAATVQGNLAAHTGLTTTAHGGIVASSDARLTDARTPTAHNQAESTITFTDSTTGNAQTTQHGFLPKLGGGTTNFFRADGTWAAPPAETVTTIGALINGATDKSTPVDADYVGLMDSAASNALKKLSWANIKATLKSYFDGLYFIVAGKSGGQTAIGGTASGENLTLQSTAHATKGKILFGTSAYDQVNNRLGVGTAAPISPLTVAVSQGTFEVLNISGSYVSAKMTGTGSAGSSYFLAVNGTNNTAFNAYGSTEAGSLFGVGRANYSGLYNSGGAGFLFGNTDSTPIVFGTNNLERMRILGVGNIGVWTTNPDKRVEINLGTSDALRLTYNDANGSAAVYTDITLSSTGVMTITPVGAAPTVAFAAPARLKGYTVATLPAGTQGDTCFVTDALAPTFLATVVGGGAIVTPVFYNGSSWIGF